MTAQARLLGGRYQVGELLGYGGMAEVHRGRDLRLGRDVAIKMLRTDLARDATFQERFRREAQNAAALNHPAIVAVYDTGEEVSPNGEKLPFIVMEFVNGRTLKEVLAAEQRIPQRRALEMIADICAALEFSHRHGIIHRDIKPGNVMLAENGQVKVMDFGIARALASGATTMTQTSAVIGTAQYLSPEQARGESVDARSDVYAAGCVLFELLCGHPPFVGDSPVSVAYQHVREDPRAPSDVNPQVSSDVDAIVLKALAKNPLNRYQSAQEMRADALRAVAGRPVMATPVMSEAETMAMAGPSGYPAGNVTRAMGPTGRGGEPPERSSSWITAVLAALGVLTVIALGVAAYVNFGGQNKESQTVDVPDIVGQDENSAINKLRAAKLKANRGEDDKSAECRQDTVVRQNPEFPKPVEPNTVVTYYICTGPGEVRVPDALVRNPYENVKTTLEGLKLKVEKKTKDDAAPENTVLELNPGAGTPVKPGSTIEVTVSAGNIIKVPNVVGDTTEKATKTLEGAGFKVDTEKGSEVPAGTEATVEGQQPTAGGEAKKGSTVTLTVTVPASPAPDPPGAPSRPTVTPTEVPNQVRVSWSAPSAGAGIAGYSVQSSPGNRDCDEPADSTATSCLVSNLAPGTSYKFRVRANGVQNSGNSQFSPPSESFVPAGS